MKINRYISFYILILVISILLIGCASNKKPGLTITAPGMALPEEVGDLQYGISSYYAEKFHGRRTANGEIYNMYGVSAAHQTLPLNSIVKVTNLENNKIIELKINDRGPFIKDRILDCSYGAAVKLGFITKGTALVKVEVLEIGDNIYRKE
jgi:rare lipoprotein A